MLSTAAGKTDAKGNRLMIPSAFHHMDKMPPCSSANTSVSPFFPPLPRRLLKESRPYSSLAPTSSLSVVYPASLSAGSVPPDNPHGPQESTSCLYGRVERGQ